MNVMMAIALALAGCGGGSRGDDEAFVSVINPTPSAAVSAPATPTAMKPTSTSTPFPEILLAAGRSFVAHDESETPLVLRNDGAQWQQVNIAAPPLTLLNGIVFSTAEVAWAFGFRGDQETPVLLRTDDAGLSWNDVTASLPPECHGIADLAFASADVGYVVSRGIVRPRTVFATVDGGRTWTGIDAFRFGALPGTYALATRGTKTELLSYDTDGTLVRRLDDLTVAPVTLDGVAFIGGQNAFTTVGSRGWIAFSGLNFPNDSARTRAAIISSAAPDAPWVRQAVALDAFADLRAIDVRDDRNGLGGGATVSDTGFAPFALVLNDDGTSWRNAPITGIPDGWTVLDVLRSRGDGGWAVATDITTGKAESAFLRSDDGGRSWHREPTPFEHDSQLHDLTRNTAAR